ncbi:restriction endonuclease subunit S [Helicobacter sp. 11S02596-1]|uniref:restriction endonuclease subunit S n=1 Tax=Helicobacter sp. 11S02596-1 TaxID=1476194 RepID=UPI000BA6AA2A|nr:restriction endonuclease subunit S [Helicobacter sp. 11S02596-1]PAF41500.1 type I restriction endonuclease subunit S [Helicobacter sp. 11S02596-1]
MQNQKIHPFVEKLLDGEGVEWKPLGEVVKIKTGQSVNKNMISENPGEYPVINSGREPLGFINEWNTENDPIGITTRGAGVGSITWQEGKYFRGNLNYSATIINNKKITIRFLYHVLQNMQKEIQELCTFDGIPALNASNLKTLQIPIPAPNNPEKSLAIQNEIVRMLDTFTKLISELTRELGLRKKQYQYYRDKLLDFKNADSFPFLQKLLNGAKVEWKPLCEIFNIKNGYTPSKANKEYWENGTIPWFRMEDIRENGRVLSDSIQKVSESAVKGGKLFPANSIMFSTLATIGEHALITVPHLSNQQLTNLSLKPEYKKTLNIKFYFYYCFLLAQWCKNNIRESSVPTIDMGDFKNFEIPIPPIETQNQIVDILDKFDALTNSLTEGLPKEIELRKKQYAYYRDLLLNFPKEESSRK